VSRSYGFINDTNCDATEGGVRSNSSRKEDTKRTNLAPSFLDNSILANKENISYQKGDIIRPSIQHIPIPNKYNTDKKTIHSDIEVSRVSIEPIVSRESKVSIESNVSRESREPKVSRVSREDFRDDISSVTEDLNMCNAFNISIGRNNHAYLNISNTSPDSYFNNLLELLSNKEYVSNITDLVFIKKTEDGKNISCIQKNNGDKKILETYINMSLNAVVKLLTKFKEQYDINIHPILIYPNAKSKLINYIKNIKDRSVYEEDYNSFNNIAKHYELYTLNNLLCSSNATKDYKKFVNLSIKFYKEYITRYEAYKKKIFKILEKKNIEKIINDMIIIQEEFNDMILKYNLYIIYSVKAYSSYTHLNILGLAEYPNIEKGILMTHKFIMETNINKLKFTDRKLDNYYLALPISIKKYDNLERSIFLE
jgi:hypothetical protein